jgi:hypothetical protein
VRILYNHYYKQILIISVFLGSIQELGQFGPMKETDKVGIDTVKESMEGFKIDKNEYYNPDPSGIRTGNGPGPSAIETFEKVAIDAENVLQKVNIALIKTKSIIIFFMYYNIHLALCS